MTTNASTSSQSSPQGSPRGDPVGGAPGTGQRNSTPPPQPQQRATGGQGNPPQG